MSYKTIQQLNHFSLIRIDGDDAASFLQGQLTNDVTLAKKEWQLTGYCSPKGRLLALLKLWQIDDTYYAVIEKSLCKATLQRLRMYVMRSKVVITELEQTTFFTAQEWVTVKSKFPTLVTPANNTVETNGSATVIRFGEQFLVISEQGEIAEDAEDNTNQWHINNISLGLPRVTIETLEMFIPQMLNLDVLGAINFKKGCYTGQEIIARLHYLGKAKQRMFVATIKGESPQIGAAVYLDDACEKQIGNIVDSAKQNLLVVLRLSALEDTTTFYLEQDSSLEINAVQPYELPASENP